MTAFADPQSAFTRYAQSVNARNWCAAIATFDEGARAELAVTAFKGFALLAGASNPKQAEYGKQFTEFCSARSLDCASSTKLADLTASLLSRASAAHGLADLKEAASKEPVAVYNEIMRRLCDVDAQSMMQFDLELTQLTVEGSTATAVATQSDGRTSKLSFMRGPAGWLLSLN